jgi:hypothetical protein
MAPKLVANRNLAPAVVDVVLALGAEGVCVMTKLVAVPLNTTPVEWLLAMSGLPVAMSTGQPGKVTVLAASGARSAHSAPAVVQGATVLPVTSPTYS